MHQKNFLWAIICATLVLLTACAQVTSVSQEDQVAPAAKRSIVQVTDDIYRFFDNNHSSLFVLTDEGIVLIDPLNLPAAQWVAGEIESRFAKPVTHVLYSHGHQDHASGAIAFGEVEIIAHKNSVKVINPPADQRLLHGYDGYDENGNGVIERAEANGDLVERFVQIDLDSNDVLTGQETETYLNRNIMLPTQTYDSRFKRMRIGGKTIEMHFVGGSHAADMSYIFFPEESLVFYVDIISLGDLPFGPLPWYSKADSENTYRVALSIPADIAVPSHGAIGTQDDVRGLQQYMTDLRERVIEKIDAGKSLEEIQGSLDMQEYTDWNYFEERLPINIQGMHRVLMQERAN